MEKELKRGALLRL